MTFHIALNMAGAVSAGAYTAGVVDFLVDALDEWYAEKDRQRALHGEETSQWTIPSHDVLLRVMTGASAGGMCSAIGSVALQERFDHIRSANPASEAPRNRLYRSWVDTIDIVPLLGAADLPGGQGPVKSLLDSTPIEAIAKQALRPDPAAAVKRKWVADQTGIILTLTNLRGVPYSVDEANGGSYEERAGYHADRIQFTVAASGAADTDESYALNYSDPTNPNWGLLATGAMATGAFPVMLASRVIERRRADYESREVTVDNGKPNEAGDCQEQDVVKPAWDDNVVPAVFSNAYVDGGATNNSPFECARLYLANAAGNGNRNPREADQANAAVISVAPFPGEETFDVSYNADAQTEISNVLGGLIGVLVSQARFQGEDLLLTKDPNVFSRFAISPSDDTATGKPALMCGALGAFGGFVDRRFRDHDYQLGRRNCQKFLKDVFVLSSDNPLFAEDPKTEGRNWYPVIPLMPGVAVEVPATNRDDFRTTPERLEEVAQAAEARVKAVVEAFVKTPGAKREWLAPVIGAIFGLWLGGKIKGAILAKLQAELAGQVTAE